MNTEPAENLANALDAEDYSAARKLLSDDCVYEIREKVIEGGDAIIGSYQENGEAGRQKFDEILYESSVSSIGQNRARIDYTDIINHQGETHIHRCAQEITWDPSGLIMKINHIDLPGEVEALEAFKKTYE